jgi:hypothetical protein
MSFEGTLVLDDKAQRSTLLYQDDSNNMQTLLMIWDPTSSEHFSDAGVAKMWQTFRTNSHSGAFPEVEGLLPAGTRNLFVQSVTRWT